MSCTAAATDAPTQPIAPWALRIGMDTNKRAGSPLQRAEAAQRPRRLDDQTAIFQAPAGAASDSEATIPFEATSDTDSDADDEGVDITVPAAMRVGRYMPLYGVQQQPIAPGFSVTVSVREGVYGFERANPSRYQFSLHSLTPPPAALVDYWTAKQATQPRLMFRTADGVDRAASNQCIVYPLAHRELLPPALSEVVDVIAAEHPLDGYTYAAVYVLGTTKSQCSADSIARIDALMELVPGRPIVNMTLGAMRVMRLWSRIRSAMQGEQIMQSGDYVRLVPTLSDEHGVNIAPYATAAKVDCPPCFFVRLVVGTADPRTLPEALRDADCLGLYV